MNDFKATVRDFLRDPNLREVHFRMNRQNAVLVKARYDDETDFIYMMSCFGDEDPLGYSLHSSNAFEYAGIYSITHDRIICPTYNFRLCFDADDEEDFRKELASWTAKRIAELVNNQPVPVTEESRAFNSRIDYYCSGGAYKEAREWYFDESLPHEYVASCDPDEWLDAGHLVKGLNHREDCIEELAAKYIRYYANQINNRLAELKLVKEEYAKLLAQKGEHFYQKRIAKAVENKDMKTVQLEIVKDGKPFSSRIESHVLRNTGCNSYTTWHMPAASRNAFENLFGRMAVLMPSEIRRITYGRKTIYDADHLEEEA